MASSIDTRGTAHGLNFDEIVATTLVSTSLATVITGVFVFTVGRLKLGTVVQYLPVPVVGGYLGYIGWFCLMAGLNQVWREQC